MPVLTKFQYDLMEMAANQNGTLVIREAHENSVQERKDVIAGHIRAVESMIPGLLTDASHEPDFAEGIRQCREAQGCGYKVYRLTDHAVQLFRTRLSKGIN